MLQTLLDGISGHPDNNRLGILHDTVKDKFPEYPAFDRFELMEAVWSLVARRLAYIDYRQHAPENWDLRLTERGRAARETETPNPDYPPQYKRIFLKSNPNASSLVREYLEEALAAYVHECYQASAVMLGVAAEGAFLEMAKSFSDWLPTSEAESYRKLLESPRRSYHKLFEEFRKRVDHHKGSVPARLTDNLDIQMNSILDFIRQYRNDAGHPTGVKVDHNSCFLSLVAFNSTVRRLSDLKDEFDGGNKAATSGETSARE